MKNEKIEFIDAHYLVGTDYWLSQNLPERPHKEYLEEFNRVNKEKENMALIYPFPSSEDGKYTKENKEVYELYKNNSNIIPVFALNTNYEECYKEVENYLKLCPKAGIVIWPILCDIEVNQIELDTRFEKFANNNNFFIYIHVGALNEKDIGRVKKIGNYGPQDAIKFAKAFPNKKFILGHLLRGSITCLEQANNMDNVVIETSGISGHLKWYENDQNVFSAYDAGIYTKMQSNQILEDLVKNKKMENKLVFGSSYPFSYWWNFNLIDELELIKHLDIDYIAKEKILFKNLKNFLNI